MHPQEHLKLIWLEPPVPDGTLGQFRLFVSSPVTPYLKIFQFKCNFISDFARFVVFGLVF